MPLEPESSGSGTAGRPDVGATNRLDIAFACLGGAQYLSGTTLLSRTLCLGSTHSLGGTLCLGSTLSLHGTPCLGSTLSLHGTPCLGSTLSLHGTLCLGSTLSLHGTMCLNCAPLRLCEQVGSKVVRIHPHDVYRDLHVRLIVSTALSAGPPVDP